MIFERRQFGLGLGAFALASIINPAYVMGCMAEVDDEPSFGEAEMLQVLASVNSAAPWTFESDGVQYQVELSLQQEPGEDVVARGQTGAPLQQVAHACGSRTFRNTASACLTVTNMPVIGELKLRVVGDDEDAAAPAVEPVTGDLYAYGTSLAQVDLDVSFGDHQLQLHSTDAAHFELVELHAEAFGDARRNIDFAATQ